MSVGALRNQLATAFELGVIIAPARAACPSSLELVLVMWRAWMSRPEFDLLIQESTSLPRHRSQPRQDTPLTFRHSALEKGRGSRVRVSPYLHSLGWVVRPGLLPFQ